MLAPSINQLDCTARVITPENIEFEYALAGPFQRLPAFLFDFAVRCAAFVGIVFLMVVLSIFSLFSGSIFTFVLLLMFFMMSWFYGIYFETRFSGRTPGKMVFKLRAISVDGRPVSATQAALRNLLRLADMCVLLPLQVLDQEAPAAYMIPTLFIGFVTMAVTGRLQRLGDLAAGTMVISESQRRSPRIMLPEDVRAFGLAEHIPATYSVSHSMAQTVALYVENRQRLSPARRHDISKHLTEPLLLHLGLLPDTSSDLLMCALYVRTFLSAEERAEGIGRMRAGQLPPRIGS